MRGIFIKDMSCEGFLTRDRCGRGGEVYGRVRVEGILPGLGWEVFLALVREC